MPSHRHIAALIGVLTAVVAATSARAAEAKPDPSFLHGVGQVVAGVVFELPKTVLDATLTEPPVIGTAVGLLAGTARALQVSAAGLIEMAAGFDPWGTKR